MTSLGQDHVHGHPSKAGAPAAVRRHQRTQLPRQPTSKAQKKVTQNCATWLSLGGGGGGADLCVARGSLSCQAHCCT